MEILSVSGDPKLAEVYVARFRNKENYLIEFVDSVDPRFSRQEKCCINVSTQFGCPVKCIMCDAGWDYKDNLTADEMLSQIDFVMKKRFPDEKYTCAKLKIHFARMGEPSLNNNVLNVLEKLPILYPASGLMPCIATVAPKSSADFFEKLLEIKNKYYSTGNFQLQFSINSTDETIRDKMIPIKKWGFAEIAKFGERFYSQGRKVSLNFALGLNIPVEEDIINKHFNPAKFAVKLTPINPTSVAQNNNLESLISFASPDKANHIAERLKKFGFDTIVSIGAEKENEIGSNCGQAVLRTVAQGFNS
jgi:23S rRNA (adenine2503-C2)-methyltransferase